MSRSQLAYPLNRGADMDVGGAADLQTDIMRFMAILSLCLVAIFALVQSLPMTPQEPLVQTVQVSEPATPVAAPTTHDVATATKLPAPESPAAAKLGSVAQAQPDTRTVQLTRPKWVPMYKPETRVQPIPEPIPELQPERVAEAHPEPSLTPVTAADEQIGFTLRFESDAALMRLVAANQIGVYAIAEDRARRMSVSESRISFWDASIPAQFHEMEVSTVPATVVDALLRTGVATQGMQWGVTLPGKLKTQLDGLMQEFQGGALVIGANGAIQREAI